MRGGQEFNEDDQREVLARHLEPKLHEVWWYKQGAYVTTAIVAVVLWFLVIGPKIATPKTDMVDPATTALAQGLKPKDPKSLSNELHIKVAPPDLRQLGGKLTRIGTDEFGGQQAAVYQYQYGKSVLLLYYFREASKQFKEMKEVRTAKTLFFVSSGGAVSVIAWQDRRSGFYALAAKATEKDLVTLAGKMVAAF